MVPVKAGGAVLIHHRVFFTATIPTSATGPVNCWPSLSAGVAGPIAEVPKWDPHELAGLPEPVTPAVCRSSLRHWDFGRRQQAAPHDGRSARHESLPWERKA